MSQIRADPSELAQTAQKFGDLAVRLSQLAAETIQAAESAPSYDGQFAPQVQGMGQEAHSRLSQQAERLRGLGEALAAIATAFESADQQSIQGFEQLVLQFRGLLDGLGQLLPGGLGATIAAGQPLLGLQPVPPPPEPPTDEGDEKSLRDRFADQLDLEFIWGVLSDKFVAARARAMKSAIPVTLVLPMLKGFGMDDVAGPLVRTFDGSFWVRSFGRIIGDASAPPLFFVGWGLSAAPELIRNVQSGAPWNEFAADLAVDGGIYVGSEAAGWLGLTGVTAFAGPEVGVPAKFIVDPIAGAALDWAVDKYDVRAWLATEIAQAPAGVSLWFANAIDESIRVEIPPIPTPPGLYSAAQTPVPPSLISGTLPTAPVQATGTPTPSVVVSDAAPVATPPPGGP